MPPIDPLSHPFRTLACALTWSLAAGLAAAAGNAPATPTLPAKTTTAQAATAQSPAAAPAATAKTPPPNADPGAVVERIRAALAPHAQQDKLRVLVGNEPIVPRALAGPAATPVRPQPRTRPQAPAAPQTTDPARWSYAGANGPEHWGQIDPSYRTCASGQRQAPISIDTRHTLQGPAEPLQLAYGSSGGSVVHTGHTLQVDVAGTHTLTVRGSRYHLQQVRFHHPAEIRIDGQAHAMAAHLLHRNDQGQMAVLVLPLEVGPAQPEIHKIWTHMPLEVNDRVPLPEGLLSLQALLPQDPRYFQFMGSLNTPPCSEGVLWLVMKQPLSLSREQLRLFAQLFPMNARPVQPLHGRVVREAQ